MLGFPSRLFLERVDGQPAVLGEDERLRRLNLRLDAVDDLDLLGPDLDCVTL